MRIQIYVMNVRFGYVYLLMLQMLIQILQFANGLYELRREDDSVLRERVETFRRQTQTRKGVRCVLVTTYGLKPNKYSGNVASQVTLDGLFAQSDWRGDQGAVLQPPGCGRAP